MPLTWLSVVVVLDTLLLHVPRNFGLVLHSLVLTEGCTPEDRPTLDDKGNVYGTAIGGGAYQAGTAFEFTP